MLTIYRLAARPVGVHEITPIDGVSLAAYLGGLTGMTAYFGLPVGRIAKITGARAVGLAGAR
jgi:NADPH-dependent curcumin reductase CurA